MPSFRGFVYTGALLNSVAFKQTEREKGVMEQEGKRGRERKGYADG